MDSVCDQVLFDNKLHPAHGKNAPFQSERTLFKYRSHHELDLGTTTSDSRGTVPVPATYPRQNLSPPAQSYAHAVKAPAVVVPIKIFQQTTLQRAVAEAKKREDQLRHGAKINKTLAPTQIVPNSSGNSKDLSVSTFRRSQGTITPPGIPNARKTALLLLTTTVDDGFVASTTTKRGRNAFDFSNMLAKQSKLPLDGIATAN
uniref:Uncharacterized protein n=1 Tax=Peronospora matthiolae TaxID=2874970 RepID=A0AAV1UKQ4_9STRA